MGSAKELMLELQQERFEAWAAEKYPEVQPDTPEWETIGQIYSDWQDFLSDQAYEDYLRDEFTASLNSVDARCEHAFTELRTLQGLNQSFQPDIVLRMSWVHAVSIMEACLMYCARALLNHEPHLRLFQSNQHKIGLRDNQTKFLKVCCQPVAPADAYREAVQAIVRGMTFHNVKHIERYFGAVLRQEPEWPVSRLKDIVNTRHDLVHRNGISEYDTETVVGRYQLERALSDITLFLEAFHATMQAETAAYRKEKNAC
ncbi:hypothetical protein [Pantoea sp. OXWO6B1]|uniref:hypothetical protein n=1 Tax=Pantoea sp. OXWO6B1 TaxID=1835724 RepID=UPI0007C63E38|nr:hypothetical protein [Pantoea sp. OXWO6B1]OAD97824.1 hypothetical protein A6A26_21760 [Pantoea sp. OXWO6B1]